MTSVFTIYIDLMETICGYEKRIQWNRRRLLDLEKQLKTFKKKGVHVFGEAQCSKMRPVKYQVFGEVLKMGTVKWHILHHICYDMYRIGTVHINDSITAGHSHQLIKRLYLQTSKG